MFESLEDRSRFWLAKAAYKRGEGIEEWANCSKFEKMFNYDNNVKICKYF